MIKLNLDLYVDRLIKNSEISNKVAVVGGGESRVFNFYSNGCGFAWIWIKGRKAKNYFIKLNEEVKKEYGFNLFDISKGYPNGFNVSLHREFLFYLGKLAKVKAKRLNLPIDFIENIGAYALQDMAFKEFILNDILEQTDYKENAYVLTRLD